MSQALVVYCRKRSSRRTIDYGVFVETNRTRHSLQKEADIANYGDEIIAFIPLDASDPGVQALISAVHDDYKRHLFAKESSPESPLHVALCRLVLAARKPKKRTKKS